jgi:DNA (cytosine-5)-methyltransferase 1
MSEFHATHGALRRDNPASCDDAHRISPGKQSTVDGEAGYAGQGSTVSAAMARPTLMSIFAGAGGLDAGLEQAGFETRLAIDVERNAIETLKATKVKRIPVDGARRKYLARASLVHADLTALTKADLVDLWADDDPPDLLAGGPPCQSFSSAGKQRGVDDERGRLFKDFVRAARALRPALVLFENVQGLITARDQEGHVGGVLQAIQAEFENAGYACSFALVNAADFGAPQRRVRLVMLGSRRHELPSFPPSATHFRDGEQLGLVPWVSLRDALKGFPARGSEGAVWASEEMERKLAGVLPGKGIRVGGVVENNRPGGHWGYRQDGFVANWHQPARTVRAASTPDWLRMEDGSHRRLTWQECACLQGFPSSWAFQGASASRFRQIGNAVPVQLARALGDQALEALVNGPMKRNVSPSSPPWPQSFRRRIRYTTSEHRVNGALRKRRSQSKLAA